MAETVKKEPFYMKWWFWVLILIILAGIAGPMQEPSAPTQSSAPEATAPAQAEQPASQEQAPNTSEAPAIPQTEQPQNQEQTPGTSEPAPQPQQTEAETPPPAPAQQEQTPEQQIEAKAKEIINELRTTSVKEIKVNQHMGTDDPDDFLVLIHLSFDAKNTVKTTRDMLDLYNNEIGARLADVDRVSELTIFWEVPYLADGNIAKANLVKVDAGMAFEDVWFDGRIFK